MDNWGVFWASASILMKKWEVTLDISINTHEKLEIYPGH